jgi:hypothetical protein
LISGAVIVVVVVFPDHDYDQRSTITPLLRQAIFSQPDFGASGPVNFQYALF